MGADVNAGILKNYTPDAKEDGKQSILDWVNVAIQVMEVELQRGQKVKEPKPVDLSNLTSWKEYATLTVTITNPHLWSDPKSMDRWITEVERMNRTKRYFEDVKELLVSFGAKTRAKLGSVENPKFDSTGKALLGLIGRNPANLDPENEASFEDFGFAALPESPYHSANLPRHLIPRYHELYEACLNDDKPAES